MPTMTVYADEHTAGASFYLSSRWESDGVKFTSSPSTGSNSLYFTINLPVGATLIKATIFARVGERWQPYTGVKSGFPKANGETFTLVDEDTDKFLHSAPVVFSDLSVSTKVTITFKANGNVSNSGKHMGSLSFDDVYLIVEYEPPCSAWDITSTSHEHTYGGSVYGNIYISDYNKSYAHKICIEYQGVVIEHLIDPVGLDSFVDTLPWNIPLNDELSLSLMKAMPPTAVSSSATICLSTISNDVVIGSDKKEIIIEIPSDAHPDSGTMMYELINSAKDQDDTVLALQNYSSARLWVESVQGDPYGSTVDKIYVDCANGHSYELKKCYTSASSSIPDEDIKGNLQVIRSESIVTEVFQVAGNYPVTIRVIDSRGNVDTCQYESIFVTPYTPITILSTSQGRTGDCLLNENLDEWYVRVAFNHYSPLMNSKCILSQILTASDGSVTTIPGVEYSSNSRLPISSPVEYCLDKNLSYKVTFTISDGLTNATITKLIGSSYAFMRWEPNKNACGFGCYPASTHSNCIEVAADWDQIVNGNIKLLDSSTGDYLSLNEYITKIITEFVSNQQS